MVFLCFLEIPALLRQIAQALQDRSRRQTARRELLVYRERLAVVILRLEQISPKLIHTAQVGHSSRGAGSSRVLFISDHQSPAVVVFCGHVVIPMSDYLT